ncbi:MAG TPA: exo-beta-N-acetylmuramidase NamZ domain-containing protein [Vicinamibacterales bacterium]|nr:exo-beta-N-acetylmuramidase NamZ domain-containing protein [Vicinamibacterales bacterium]
MRRRHLRLLASCLTCALVSHACASAPRSAERRATPSGSPVLDEARLGRIDPLITEAIAGSVFPGAVVVVGDRRGVVYRKAFGQRAVVPAPEPMTLDTVFDLASLTKVVATTPAVLALVEQGRLGLDDSIARFLPEMEKYGKDRISVRHLLTHTSGLRPGLDLALPFEGTQQALELIAEEVPVSEAGRRFIYSDLNFILLGEIVARVSGVGLDQFAAERIFEPLGMKDTAFRPGPDLLPRIAPTEPCAAEAGSCDAASSVMLRGVVHDPTARRMGGVSGHAGLFGSADDLARFCRMVLNHGQLDGTRVLSPLAVELMTRANTPPHIRDVRALGLDIDSPYASPRGDLFPVGSFGHAGWTGTSFWMDPFTGTFVVLLSNRVHPDGPADIRYVRERLATIVAAAATGAPPLQPGMRQAGSDYGARAPARAKQAASPVLAGIDVLALRHFEPLRGRRVGLLTNHTGLTATGASTIDVLRSAPGVTLVALFSPEHGIRGRADEPVSSGRDERTGLPIHSLYGESRRPSDEMLAGIDTIVIDLQDIGARFYTYMTTMAYMLEAAATKHLRVVVLDRPNPITGYLIEGPIQEEAAKGFTGYFPMPIRHGLTMGELARLFNEENRIGTDLIVVPMRGWSRERWYDETGLMWTNPSPNLRNMHQAVLYPGIGALEFSNISVGRGTDAPFEQIGAPWIDGRRLAAHLNARGLPGIRFYPVAFTPTSSVYANEECQGVFMLVTDRSALRPVHVGLEIAAALFALHGERYELRETWRLFGSREQLEALRRGATPESISERWRRDEARWRLLRAKYLLY